MVDNGLPEVVHFRQAKGRYAYGVKDEILRSLIETEGAVSGEALAETLGVSRNSIWKAVNQLREEGFPIEGTTRQGYHMREDIGRVCVPAIQRHLGTSRLGRTIELYESLGSTNDRIRELAEAGAPEGTVVVAREQSTGRGRFQRSFYSPLDQGVYFTVLLRPDLAASEAVMITVLTAVAVARAIERVGGIETGIKWVNDVYLKGKKACGILCEASMDLESGQLKYVAVGIGINTGMIRFPGELSRIATSIGNATGKAADGNRVIAEVLKEMEVMYDALPKRDFLEEYRRRSVVIGRRIEIRRGEERAAGVALDIEEEGGLLVETDEGQKTLRSGEISVHLEEV